MTSPLLPPSVGPHKAGISFQTTWFINFYTTQTHYPISHTHLIVTSTSSIAYPLTTSIATPTVSLNSSPWSSHHTHLTTCTVLLLSLFCWRMERSEVDRTRNCPLVCPTATREPSWEISAERALLARVRWHRMDWKKKTRQFYKFVHHEPITGGGPKLKQF